ncbi:histidinol-phosphate transaminase [Agrococcus lahaulensis]|uniref:histidinol-phosphate transaminase n=1 Tax=Agrococcus sp. BE272 TaxID=2817727 RepID=UPI000FE2DA24|nr:histidinol-phosphate transaminase [Agrococcus sp. BE272]MDR7232879.1 histidinol-phosphate aminotransferase [Agrococcus sp. BE272]RWR24150.1 histidinol-phosphate transaminase [Agrococcus lahaulensis]
MTSLDDLPIRDDLRGLTPYGAPQLDVPVRLNVNENAYRVPEAVALDIVQEIARALPDANRYPDREFDALRAAFAGYLGHGLQSAQIWAGNGSNEVLQHVLQAFGGPGRSLLSFTPTYSMYPLLAQGVGMRWVPVPRADDFTLTPQAVREAIAEHDPDVVFLCSPNNPTGTAIDLETIEAAAEAARGIVLVDEAYAEFAHDRSRTALTLLERHPRLLVSRTMSKAFAFAGIRVGYLAADPAVIDALRLVRLPYHLSALTQAAAVAALRHSDAMLSRVDELRTQRDRIVDELTALGYRPYPSDANFVLVGGIDDPRATFEALLERGILVRDVGLPHTLRITAGTAAETTVLLSAMAALRAE